MARQFSQNRVMNAQWLAKQMQWPPPIPTNIGEMSKLESLHDVFDVYLWLRSAKFLFRLSFSLCLEVERKHVMVICAYSISCFHTSILYFALQLPICGPVSGDKGGAHNEVNA